MGDGDPGVARALGVWNMAEHIEKELKRRMAKRGKLGLPPTLDARRLKYGVPNGAFKIAPIYDTVYVFQLPTADGTTFQEGGAIEMPQAAMQQIVNESPRGLLVAAGLRALDELRSNGVDVGHIVQLHRLSPYRLYVDTIAGYRFTLVMLRAGDIRGSEDLQAALAAGECKVVFDEKIAQHVFVDKKGKRWNPVLPWLPDDM
jgi:hypothetical protein